MCQVPCRPGRRGAFIKPLLKEIKAEAVDWPMLKERWAGCIERGEYGWRPVWCSHLPTPPWDRTSDVECELQEISGQEGECVQSSRLEGCVVYVLWLPPHRPQPGRLEQQKGVFPQLWRPEVPRHSPAGSWSGVHCPPAWQWPPPHCVLTWWRGDSKAPLLLCKDSSPTGLSPTLRTSFNFCISLQVSHQWIWGS